jgi:ABC-2 type transport system permease protein
MPPSEPVPATSIGFWQPCATLWLREMIRFLRQRSRIIGALGTPLVFWLLIGGGLKQSFRLPGVDSQMTYLEYSFPGAIIAILLFTAIFSMISIIDDRKEGFLQAVLVAPVSRASIALGKMLGATTLAVGQALLFLALSRLANIRLGALSISAVFATMTLVAFALTGLGFVIAWRMESTQGFHAIMNLLLMPMLVISGAFFPPGGSAAWLHWIMLANPVTYCVTLLRWALYLDAPAPHPSLGGNLAAAWAVTILFAGGMFLLAMFVVRKDTARVLQ